MLPILQGFIDEYRTKGVPPPYVLLVGRDEDQHIRIFSEFARAIGDEGQVTKASEIAAIRGFLASLTWRKAVLITGVQTLKRDWAKQLGEVLSTGEFKTVNDRVGRRKVNVRDVFTVAFFASCPSKHECPTSLLNQFRCVVPIDPYTPTELLALLEAEAWKDRISFEPGAVELLVKCSDGMSGLLLSRFRKVIGVLDQVRHTNKPCLTVSEIETALRKLRIEIPQTITKPTKQIDDLSGIEFESLIRALLLEMGFQAELTAVTGDGGIDIIATLDRPFCGGRYIFQCKRYAGEDVVGAPAIRDFYGAVTADRAVKGIFITTSDFTTQAKNFAAQVGIELVNRPRLDELLEEYKIGIAC